MIKELITIAGYLDKRGLLKEADYLDALIRVASNCGSKADDNVSDEQNEKFNMDGDDKAFEPEDFKMLREKNENSADDEEKTVECPKCTTMNFPSATHCTNCGHKLR